MCAVTSTPNPYPNLTPLPLKDVRGHLMKDAVDAIAASATVQAAVLALTPTLTRTLHPNPNPHPNPNSHPHPNPHQAAVLATFGTTTFAVRTVKI